MQSDGYQSAGPGEKLKWLKAKLEQRYRMKYQVLNMDSVDGDEIRVLSRVVRRTSGGYELEDGLRYVQPTAQEMCSGNFKAAAAPGIETEGIHEKVDGEDIGLQGDYINRYWARHSM